MKHCNFCNQDLELDAFGRNRAAKDGLNAYCKPCNRRRTSRHREVVQRKSNVMAPHDKVMRAIRRGYQTREQIRRSAGLSWNRTMDAIAKGIDQGVLGYKRVDGEPLFFERVA